MNRGESDDQLHLSSTKYSGRHKEDSFEPDTKKNYMTTETVSATTHVIPQAEIPLSCINEEEEERLVKEVQGDSLLLAFGQSVLRAYKCDMFDAKE